MNPRKYKARANIQIRCEEELGARFERIAIKQGRSNSQLGRLLVIWFCEQAEAGEDVSKYLAVESPALSREARKRRSP